MRPQLAFTIRRGVIGFLDLVKPGHLEGQRSLALPTWPPSSGLSPRPKTTVRPHSFRVLGHICGAVTALWPLSPSICDPLGTSACTGLLFPPAVYGQWPFYASEQAPLMPHLTFSPPTCHSSRCCDNQLLARGNPTTCCHSGTLLSPFLPGTCRRL